MFPWYLFELDSLNVYKLYGIDILILVMLVNLDDIGISFLSAILDIKQCLGI